MIEARKHVIVNTDMAQTLYKKLLPIFNHNTEEVLCLMNDLDNDSERLQILKLIEKGLKNPDNLILKALEFRGIVGTPIEEIDDNPEDILNWDDCTEEEKRIITENYQKRLEREAQNKN